MGKLKVTILGTGTSQGVPVIACHCPVCMSEDPRDKRLRCSVLLETEDGNFVIDSGPDFRQQMLRENVQTLQGILFTHEHKDHVAGMDDVRAFNFKENRAMDVYCTKDVEQALRREFHYIFHEISYPGIPRINLINFGNSDIRLSKDITIKPIRVMHYLMEVFGFRIGNFAYITDAKTVDREEIDKLQGLDILVVNCLRKEPHVSHFNLDEALWFIEQVKPKKAYLTHISHLLGKHADVEKELPENIGLSFDGQRFEFDI